MLSSNLQTKADAYYLNRDLVACAVNVCLVRDLHQQQRMQAPLFPLTNGLPYKLALQTSFCKSVSFWLLVKYQRTKLIFKICNSLFSNLSFSL